MDRDAAEIRVLGCLVENQRTTPDAYPLEISLLAVLELEERLEALERRSPA